MHVFSLLLTKGFLSIVTDIVHISSQLDTLSRQWTARGFEYQDLARQRSAEAGELSPLFVKHTLLMIEHMTRATGPMDTSDDEAVTSTDESKIKAREHRAEKSRIQRLQHAIQEEELRMAKLANTCEAIGAALVELIDSIPVLIGQTDNESAIRVLRLGIAHAHEQLGALYLKPTSDLAAVAADEFHAPTLVEDYREGVFITEPGKMTKRLCRDPACSGRMPSDNTCTINPAHRLCDTCEVMIEPGHVCVPEDVEYAELRQRARRGGSEANPDISFVPCPDCDTPISKALEKDCAQMVCTEDHCRTRFDYQNGERIVYVPAFHNVHEQAMVEQTGPGTSPYSVLVVQSCGMDDPGDMASPFIELGRLGDAFRSMEAQGAASCIGPVETLHYARRARDIYERLGGELETTGPGEAAARTFQALLVILQEYTTHLDRVARAWVVNPAIGQFAMIAYTHRYTEGTPSEALVGELARHYTQMGKQNELRVQTILSLVMAIESTVLRYEGLELNEPMPAFLEIDVDGISERVRQASA